MTKQELVSILTKLYNDGDYDQEEAHIDADNALIDYIDDVEIQKAYSRIGKWYA